jgi:hypothetical protein
MTTVDWAFIVLPALLAAGANFIPDAWLNPLWGGLCTLSGILGMYRFSKRPHHRPLWAALNALILAFGIALLFGLVRLLPFPSLGP